MRDQTIVYTDCGVSQTIRNGYPLLSWLEEWQEGHPEIWIRKARLIQEVGETRVIRLSNGKLYKLPLRKAETTDATFIQECHSLGIPETTLADAWTEINRALIADMYDQFDFSSSRQRTSSQARTPRVKVSGVRIVFAMRSSLATFSRYKTQAADDEERAKIIQAINDAHIFQYAIRMCDDMAPIYAHAKWAEGRWDNGTGYETTVPNPGEEWLVDITYIREKAMLIATPVEMVKSAPPMPKPGRPIVNRDKMLTAERTRP